MATLQKIRSKGPLLLIVIGLAMLAFILGDAWKIIRPTQGMQYVGSIDGTSISAMDFQKEVENYTEVIKFANQISDLSEEQTRSVRDEVWAMMVRNYILEKEASAMGLAVTDAEVRDVIAKGDDPILAATPFNGADGRFDADRLKDFLAFYSELNPSDVAAEEYAYYQSMYKYWLFIEKDIKSGLLYSKYVSLVKASIVTNPIAAQNSFVNRVKRSDILVALMPYSELSDADIEITNSDLKKTYAENKERLLNYAESRDIYYIDFAIQPSQADREALLAEVNEYTTQLEEMSADYASFVRRAGSDVLYSEVPRSAKNLPEDVAERLDSVNRLGVFGPYFCEYDNTYNTFKVLNTVSGYDSIQFSLIQVIADNDADADKRADSILNAAKKGADFAELAAKYLQVADENWLSADSYEPSVFTGENAAYINKLNSMKKGELGIFKMSGYNFVVKVLDTKTPLKKYDVAIVKRPAEFSEETSNAAYNKLSAFVSQFSTIDQLKDNMEGSDFTLLYYPSFMSDSYDVNGVAKSHEALRWAFSANEGEISRIFEAGNENDHLLVVAVDKINKRGYTSLDDAAKTLSLRAVNDKKAEVLKKKLSGMSFDELKSVEGIVIDTVRYCNFTNNAYISGLFGNEPALGPSVANLELNEPTLPIKGENCVFVAEKISDDEVSSQFDAETEKVRLQSVGSSYIPGSILEALYYNAKVVDERYKIF